MSIMELLLVSVLGFAIVFAVLIVLMGIIKLLSLFTKSLDKGNTQSEPAAQPLIKAANTVPAVGSLGNIQLHSVDDKTAAMLMAIVADELQAPLNELRFISIRQIS